MRLIVIRMFEKKYWEKESFLLLILICICLILFFYGLGIGPMGDIDEAMHASTSKDMVLSQDWVTPRYNGENFFDKPPLHNWLVAISLAAFGFHEFAARLPAALLGLGCVVITYWLGRRMFGPPAAFLSALVLATSAEFIILSRVVVHDISLVFFDTLALTLFFIGYQHRRRRKTAFLAGYAALGGAVLAKGPVGLAIPLMIIGLFLIYKKDLRFIRKMQLPWGIIIFLAVAAPWYILISLRNPEYTEYFFLKQNIGNFLSGEARHPRPFYYYIPVLLGGLFPWSPFLPLAIWSAFRKRSAEIGDGLIFALIWFGTVLLFFSAASSKLGTYILPLFPAASLLMGALWNDLIHRAERALHKGVLFSHLPLAVMAPLALIWVLFFPPGALTAESSIKMSWIYLAGAWLAVCTSISLVLAAGRKYRAFVGSMAAMAATLFLMFLILVVPVLGPNISGKELALRLDKLMAPGDSITFYLKARASFLFYTDRRAELLQNPGQLQDYINSPERVYCVFKQDDWEDVENLHDGMQIVAQVGDKLIVTNKRSGS